MSSRCGTLLVTGLLLVVHARAQAWSAPTRMRMADEAVRLMPPSLRLALEHHREDLMRGLLEPMTREDELSHRPPWEGGSLDSEIAARMEGLAQAAGDMKSFREVARRFGDLAHFVLDTTFPPGAAGAQAAARYQHFSRFCESRLDRMPLVFYGHEDAELQKDDYRAFALDLLKQARAEDRELARAYALAGEPPDPAAFDDRSLPFAVASLSYSRSITHIVNAWLAAWGGAGGDLRQTPYLKSAGVYRREGRAP